MKDALVVTGYVAGLLAAAVVFFLMSIWIVIETDKFVRTLWLN